MYPRKKNTIQGMPQALWARTNPVRLFKSPRAFIWRKRGQAIICWGRAKRSPISIRSGPRPGKRNRPSP